ncbi:hypothetical protein YC2023_016922 [Brassica napus]
MPFISQAIYTSSELIFLRKVILCLRIVQLKLTCGNQEIIHYIEDHLESCCDQSCEPKSEDN